MAQKLTPKEQKFIDAYAGEAAGNGAKAAILAGYARGSAKVTASKLLKKPNVRAALANREREVANLAAEVERATQEAADVAHRSLIADAAERRHLLTTMARSTEQHPLARLKAVDILNRMDGLYIASSTTVTTEGGRTTVTHVHQP